MIMCGYLCDIRFINVLTHIIIAEIIKQVYCDIS